MLKLDPSVLKQVNVSAERAQRLIEETPPKRTRPNASSVVYADGYDAYPQVLDRALAEVTARKYATYEWQKRIEQEGLRMTPPSILAELRRQNFFSNEAQRIILALKDISKGEWQGAFPGPLSHLARISPEWIDALDPIDRQWCCNEEAFFGPYPNSLLELRSNLHNNISLSLSDAVLDNGQVDEAFIEEKWKGLGTRLLALAREGLSQRAPAQLHWDNFRGTPYVPLERPISFSDYAYLKRANPQLAEELLTAAPIPQKLPSLQEVADANDISFSGYELVLGQHFLGSLCPLLDTLMQKQADPASISTFSVPYSANPLVMEAVCRKGVFVSHEFSPFEGDPSDIDRQMERDAFYALQRAVSRAKASGKKLLFIDDGGILVRLLSKRAKYVGKVGYLEFEYAKLLESVRGLPIRIVEQTTRGVTEYQAAKDSLSLDVTIVNMARSPAKAQADRYIGPVVVQSLEQGIWNLGRGTLKGKSVCLIGYGFIGRWIAECLRLYGATVTVLDIDENNLRQAAERGFLTETKLREAMKDKDVVLGCTGHTSVSYEDFEECRRGAIFASATSKAVEFFTQHLKRRHSPTWPTAPGTHGQGEVISTGDASQHHHSYQVVQWDKDNEFNQSLYFLLNNGVPINFDGEVNCADPEHIQVTEAVKFEALVQASLCEAGLGLLDMEEERQIRALAAQDKHVPGWRE